MIGAFLRNRMFWILDSLKGGKIKKYYKQVKYDMENDVNNDFKIKLLMNYIKKNVPYYKAFVSVEKFEHLPVLNKNIYMENYNDFIGVDYKNVKLHEVSTSGSTGIPFKCVQDVDKRNKHTADLVYFHNKCGWNIGDRYIFMRAWTSLYDNSKINSVKNNVISIDVVSLNEETIKKILKRIRTDKSIKMILGYGSSFNQIASYMMKNDICVNSGVKTIISDSDLIEPKYRKELERRFGCSVVDRYSNEEHGLLAFSYKSGAPYEVNRSSYRIEILDMNSDNYADVGEVGRIIITDLYNKAMPLVRYEVGDLGIALDNTRDVHFLKCLQGRTADMIIISNGNKISSATINNYFEKMKKIKQYQLIQNNVNAFTLNVVEYSEGYSDNVYSELINSFYMGSAKLKINRVNKIPVQKNGKYKAVIGIN